MRHLLKYRGRFTTGGNLVPRGFILYVARFLGSFLVLYFGTLLIIGLSSKDHYYSSFVARYLDFVTPLRWSLLHASDAAVRLLGYQTSYQDDYTLAIDGGRGIRIVYSCVGYGVMSFWAAFIIANYGNIGTKIKWLLSGWMILWSINVLRISLLLLADVRNWGMPLGLDHHTLFNVAAYGAIFFLIYVYDKRHSAAYRQPSPDEN
ncbi:MAG: hypothetical protein EOP49_41395 [Sphingobacteriales bacterium]|nr:MAG: hypothetical protein EOP49_41395 [Sphingobacteriales bacterium]